MVGEIRKALDAYDSLRQLQTDKPRIVKKHRFKLYMSFAAWDEVTIKTTQLPDGSTQQNVVRDVYALRDLHFEWDAARENIVLLRPVYEDDRAVPALVDIVDQCQFLMMRVFGEPSPTIEDMPIAAEYEIKWSTTKYLGPINPSSDTSGHIYEALLLRGASMKRMVLGP